MTWEIFGHCAVIAGRVTDALSGRTVLGARIEITDSPPAFAALLVLRAKQYGASWERRTERVDRTRTAADGHYHFLDLPAGDYTLSASLPVAGSRYAVATAQVTVTTDGNGKSQLTEADLALAPTTVQGRLTETDASPISLAEVRVAGSDEHTLSDTEGNYRLSGLETGQRTLLISAQGFFAPPQTVVFSQAGDLAQLDLSLEPE